MAWGKKKNPGYSYFAVGATLEGRLCFTGIIRLDGRVNGEIVSSGTLVVEETAIITGNVLVESIILSGTIYGNITAFKHVQLNASAKVYGHISYGELSIEGALHEGSSHKLSSDEIEEMHRQCLQTMEEAAANADRSKPDQISLEQYAATLEAADRPAGGGSSDKKLEIASPKKPALLPSGKSNPAPPAKTGEASAPILPTKPGETNAPPLAAKPGAEAPAGKGGDGWSSVKGNSVAAAKNAGAQAVKPPPAAGKASS